MRFLSWYHPLLIFLSVDIVPTWAVNSRPRAQLANVQSQLLYHSAMQATQIETYFEYSLFVLLYQKIVKRG